MTDHPFTRTTCACRECVACCERQPGPLAPGDLENICAALSMTLEEARDYFVASPGALVGNSATGERFRIGTITPRRQKPGGPCVFLDEQQRCRIHAVAPFGCAYFDTHMNLKKANKRSVWLARATASAAYQYLRSLFRPAEETP